MSRQKGRGGGELDPIAKENVYYSNLTPAFLHMLCKINGGEPGRFHHVHDDVLCEILCVVLVIELLPTQRQH